MASEMVFKDNPLFYFLRRSLGVGEISPVHLTPEEWKNLFLESLRQSLLGVVFSAVCKLPKDELPPKQLLVRWAACAEGTREMNALLNREAARLTEIFSKAGRRTAILKGPANARLYPDAGCRHCGDIDIWVEGGYKSVEALLMELKLIEQKGNSSAQHHIELPKSKDGVVVEVHVKPASGNPYRNSDLQKFLNEEIVKAELVPEGFYVPSIKFALVMQLSHLQQHFFREGLGLRQYMDYFVLLQNSSESDRREVSAVIKSLYMLKACGAVMWVLGEVFGLERERMLCAPNAWRGKALLELAFKGGNFGQYIPLSMRPRNVFDRWLKDRLRTIRWLSFDPVNVVFKELRYWKHTISLIPRRIKRRRISL